MSTRGEEYNWLLRRQYGPGLVVRFTRTGLEVPCRKLTMGEVLHFTHLFSHGEVPNAVIEDEIFSSTVQYKYLVDQIDELPAGVVTLVAQTVLSGSGLPDRVQFNSDLEAARAEIETPTYQCLTIILRAFPGYTPEDVRALSYEAFMTNLAQAEKLLIERGQLAEPISMDSGVREKPVEPTPHKDLRSEWERKQRELEVARQMSTSKNRTWIDQGPPPPGPTREDMLAKHDKIDFDSDNADLLMAGGGMDGHDMGDFALIEQRAMRSAELAFPHLFPSKSSTEVTEQQGVAQPTGNSGRRVNLRSRKGKSKG